MPPNIFYKMSNQQDSSGLIPLISALKYFGSDPKCLEVVRELLPTTILQVFDHKGRTVLHYAAIARLEILEFLLKEMGADTYQILSRPDNNGLTPLMWAVKYSHLDAESLTPRLKLLSKTGLGERDTYGRTSLHLAAARGDPECVELLLEKKASTLDTDKRGNTALHYAACKGKEEAMNLLLEWDEASTFNRTNYDDRTPLSLALEQSHTEAVDLLWKRSEKPTTLYKYDLHYAASMGKTEIVKFFLDQGVPQNKDKEGNTPLHLAAGENRVDTVALLLEQRGVMLEVNNQNITPLSLALAKGHVEIALRIIARFPLPPIGRYDLHYAAQLGLVQVAKVLLEAGAPINAQDRLGNTALHEAAYNQRVNMVRYLLAQDGIQDVLNSKKGLALSYALHRQNREMANNGASSCDSLFVH